MMDVFEHIEDYLGFLKKCKNKAVNLIFHIPLDISIQVILRNKLISRRESAGHLHYFTKETALATLEDSGYEIIDYCYTEGAIEQPSKTLKGKLAILPRKIMFMINENLAEKLIGGFSLLVLAK